MSWQAYVDTSLVGSGDVDKAAIFSAAGDSVWATSKGFQVSPAEMKAVLAAYSNGDDARANGLHIAGVKYILVKNDDRSLYGKKGKEGAVIVKTKQAILVAHYPDTVQPGSATNTVEKLGDYLIGMGY